MIKIHVGTILTLNTHAHDRTRARPIVAAGVVDPAARSRSAARAVLGKALGRVVSEGVVPQAVPPAAPLVFPTPGGI